MPALAALVFVTTAAAAAAQQPADSNNRPDTPGTGRFPAIKEEVASLPAHVVYRPKDLAALGAVKLGVVAWGNGGCSDDGASSRLHLLEIASHGYLVIASGRILSGPGAPPREPRPAAQPGQILPPRTKASDLTDAIDWALAENARSGSPFFGRIDPALVAYSGWSCGGLQALQVAKDPRVKTMVLHNTGVLNDGPGAIPGMDVRKDVLTTLHTPTIYILGGPKDIAYANGMDDFARIAHVPVAVANLPVGHGGTFLEPNGGAAASVAVSWLDWQLRGDTAERRTVRRGELRTVSGRAVVAAAQAVPGSHHCPYEMKRRDLLKRGAAAVAAAAGPAGAVEAQQGATAGFELTGRRFRAFIRTAAGASVREVRLSALRDDMVVIRTEATQCCYTIVNQALGSGPVGVPAAWSQPGSWATAASALWRRSARR